MPLIILFGVVCMFFVKIPPRKRYNKVWVRRERTCRCSHLLKLKLLQFDGLSALFALLLCPLELAKSSQPSSRTIGGYSTHLENISQIGSFPQVGLKIEKNWNHHLEKHHRNFDAEVPTSSKIHKQKAWPKWSKMEGVGRGSCFSWSPWVSAGLILPALLFNLVPPVPDPWISHQQKSKDTVISKSIAKLYTDNEDADILQPHLSNEGSFSMKSCQSDSQKMSTYRHQDQEFPARPFL